MVRRTDIAALPVPPGARRSAGPVIAGMLGYVWALGWACHAKYRLFLYGDFDLAIDAQTIWNILHGSLESSIHGIPFLGNHMRLFLFLLAPLYALWPSPLLLLHLQTMLLASGAWWVHRLAQRQLPPPYPVLLPLAYLLYPPLILMNLYEFHPVACAVAFLLPALDAYDRRRFAVYVVCLALALSCQENMGLVVMMFGIRGLLERRSWRWVLAPGLAGLAWFLAAVLWIMPACSRGTIQFFRVYAHLGNSLPAVLVHLLQHPAETVMLMAGASQRRFVLTLLLPLGMTSLAAPATLLPVLPVLAQRLLSLRPSETSLAYHYQAEFIPFLFAAAVSGIARLRRVPWRGMDALLVSAVGVTTLVSFLAAGIPAALAVRVPAAATRVAAEHRALLDRVPADARVMATFAAQPRLANRLHLYSLHHLYTGYYTLSDVPYPTPAVDWVIIDTADPLTFGAAGFGRDPDGWQRLQMLLPPAAWSRQAQSGTWLVFRRHAQPLPQRPLTCAVNAIPAAGPDVLPVACTAEAGLPLEPAAMRLTLLPGESRGILATYWLRHADVPLDLQLQVRIQDDERVYYEGIQIPGHRLQPPHVWPTDQLMEDMQVIALSTALPQPEITRLRAAIRYPGSGCRPNPRHPAFPGKASSCTR